MRHLFFFFFVFYSMDFIIGAIGGVLMKHIVQRGGTKNEMKSLLVVLDKKNGSPELNNTVIKKSIFSFLEQDLQPQNRKELDEQVKRWIADPSQFKPEHHISKWDTSKITDMSGLFKDKINFNDDIGNWDTSKVTTMKCMFHEANMFNQDIRNWDTSNVVNMKSMFEYAIKFNQDISEWNTHSVTDMSGMFALAENFNQDISEWKISSVIDMEDMFYEANAFDQDLRDWKTINVTNMFGMFAHSGMEEWFFPRDLNNRDLIEIV